jgi:hypothetical protein
MGTKRDHCHLFLPIFSNSRNLVLAKNETEKFGFPGNAMSKRDAMAAFHITTLLSKVLDPGKIKILDADSFQDDKASSCIDFIFGSRSNFATTLINEEINSQQLLRFEFDDLWKIKCTSGNSYEIPDPSKLDIDAYSQIVDYGVIWRHTRSNDKNKKIFLIAGLGSRATEGCGYYLAKHWGELHRKFKHSDFAVVLRFDPPVSPENGKPIEWLHSSTFN